MRSKTDILLVITFTTLILSIVLIAQNGIEHITGFAAGNAKVCVGNTPTLIPIGNLNATSGVLFEYDVNHTIANSDPVTYADTAIFTINKTTGEISFTPTDGNVGNYTIVILVNNTACMELGDSEELDFEVKQGNRAPVLETIGNHTVVQNEQFSFTLNATDEDGDNITYACNASAEDYYYPFTVNETTGVIGWWTTAYDVGLNWFICNATDDYGAYDSELFYINVTNVNDAPVLDLIPNFTVMSGNPLYEDQPFYYDVNATDIDGDDIEYLANKSVPIYNPDTTESYISSTTGEIAFTPHLAEVGNHSVEIYVIDLDEYGIPRGTSDFQIVLFEVLEVNDPPKIEPPIGTLTAQANSPFPYDVNATDEEDGRDSDGFLTFSDDTDLFDINPTTGEISFTPAESDIGNYTINISVTDRGLPLLGQGNETVYELISFVVTEANRPPNITSYSPETPFSMQAGQSQDFTITVEDPDSGYPSAKWYLDGSLVQKNSNSDTYTYTFSPSSTGTYNITVVVTDGELDDLQEWTITVTAPPGPPGPAGAEAGGRKILCKELWICTDWSTCMITDKQIRECKDLNDCGTTLQKPPQVRSCIFVLIPTCFDGVLNQDEILIDCGGICRPCPHCDDGICNQGEQCEICKEDPNHPRCPKNLEGDILPDCGGPCPLCPKIEKPIKPQGTNWKAITAKIAKITFGIILILLILAMIIIKIIRKMSKESVLTEQEKAELKLVEEINKMIANAEKAIDTKDMENLKLICANIETLYNSLSSTKNKRKIYPKIKRLKKAIRIGF